MGRGLQYLSLTLALLMSMQTLTWAQSNPLAQYRWKNRALLIFAEDAADSDVRQTRDALQTSACEVADRDIVIGWILSRGESRLDEARIDAGMADTLRSRLRVREDEFAAVLVGKDGGVKARYGQTPDLKELFALIDGMPMRRSEMRERGLECVTD
ncbi:MAG: DUF4174 domain-containing protein [Betaproteobacteria bacterium]|nr:MAG: DUF4174 domain-containing protein [Betaproteobacteria bacterium]